MADDVQETPDQPAQDATDNKTFSAEYVKELRQEAAKARTEKRDLEAKLSSYEQSKTKEEEERLAKQNEWKELADKRAEKIATYEAEKAEHAKQLKQERVRSAFVSKAAGKVVDIDAAYQLANLSSVEVSETGEITGVDEVISALIEAKPYLVANGKTPAPNLDGGAGGGQRPGGKPLSDEEMAIAKKMGLKPEDYQKFKS